MNYHVLCAVCVCLSQLALAADPNTPPSKYPRIVIGKVVDTNDKPIQGARIEYGQFSRGPEHREFTLSDEKGEYRLEITKAGPDYRLGCAKTGYAPAYVNSFIPGPVSEPSKHDFKLRGGASVNLRVVTKNGKPVSGLEFRPMTPTSGFHSSFSIPVPQTPLPGADRAQTSDADGRLSFNSLPTMAGVGRKVRGKTVTNWLGFKYKNKDSGTREMALTVEQVAAVKPGEPVTITVPDFAVPAEANASIKGRVVDKATGKPIKDFVVVRRYSPDANPQQTEDGRFKMGGNLRPGRAYQTRVFAPNYAVCVAKAVANVDGAIREEVFKMEEHPSLFGRLVDEEGKPIVGVEIVSGACGKGRYSYVEWSSLDSYADGHHSLENVLRVKTDEKGEFCIPEMPEMRTSLVIKADGYGRMIIPPNKRPEAGSDGYVEITLTKEATLVAIADQESELGRAAGGISISHQANDGFDHMYHSTKYDENGRLEYKSLAPGTYNVILYTDSANSSYPSCSKSVTLKAGETAKVTLGTMFGDIRIAGRALPFATIKGSAKGVEKGPTNFVVNADIDGDFTVGGLMPGTYTFSMHVHSGTSGYINRRGQGGKTVEITKDQKIDLVANPEF